jgi:Fe-S-cluster containining protein
MITRDFKPIAYCAVCGGECCKRMPGSYVPADILCVFGSVKAALKSGRVAIDRVEGMTPLYFMRPAIKGQEGKVADYSWGGECTNLTTSGCCLPHENKPYFCRLLKPGKRKCLSSLKQVKNDKELSAYIWKRSGIDLKKYLKRSEIEGPTKSFIRAINAIRKIVEEAKEK